MSHTVPQCFYHLILPWQFQIFQWTWIAPVLGGKVGGRLMMMTIPHDDDDDDDERHDDDHDDVDTENYDDDQCHDEIIPMLMMSMMI